MKEDFFLLLMISRHWTGTFFPGSRGSRRTYSVEHDEKPSHTKFDMNWFMGVQDMAA